MTDNAFTAALARRNAGRPPVWMMRQAGRYHGHYQALKRHHEFLQLCKDPQLAAETAMGPVHDFNFDAAILFSDLLFPLEAMGLGLRYDPGPKLDGRLAVAGDAMRLTGGAHRAHVMDFQAEALRLTRRRLRADKGLIGFVGGPFTLYVYATAGSHEAASESLPGLSNGLYDAFNDKLIDMLAANMASQAAAGADCIAVLDTAAGEVDAQVFSDRIVPVLARLLAAFRKLQPTTPVLYYSRGTSFAQWDALADLPVQGLGIDWRTDIVQVLERYGERYAIQGNVDPEWMLQPWATLEPRLREYFRPLVALPPARRAGWICGLGHGVLQKTPEQNVRGFVQLQRELFG